MCKKVCRWNKNLLMIGGGSDILGKGGGEVEPAEMQLSEVTSLELIVPSYMPVLGATNYIYVWLPVCCMYTFTM